MALEPVLINPTASDDGQSWRYDHGSGDAELYMPYAAVTPFDYGAVGDGVTDDAASLNAFFAAIAATDVGVASVAGTFAVASAVTVGPAAGTTATMLLVGRMKLVATASIATMVTVRNCLGMVWSGLVELVGTGSNSYASRTCRIGLHVTTGGRVHFTAIRATYFSEWGVLLTGSGGTNSSLCTIGPSRILDCGSGHDTYSLTSTWNTKVDAGSSGSVGQSSTITVATLPPATLGMSFANSGGATYNGSAWGPVLAVISGKTYYITSVDSATSKITVYPWIDTGVASGTLTYLFGGALGMFGGDANVVGVEMLDAQRCGSAVHNGALYGPVINRLVAQACGAGLTLGIAPAGASVGGQYSGVYFELNTFDIVRVTRSAMSASLVSQMGLDLSKVSNTSAPRVTATNDMADSTTAVNSLAGVAIQISGLWYTYQGLAKNSEESFSTYTLDVTGPTPSTRVIRQNSPTIALATPNLNANQWFGYDSANLLIIGTGASSEPTGTITFTPPSGYTANGGASATFSGLSAPAQFFVYLRRASTDFVVVRK